MKNLLLRTLSAILIFITLLSVCSLSSCSRGDDGDGYTYRTYTSALATNWNPHTWEVNADRDVLSYLSSPLVDVSISDSEAGKYTWVYEMASSITDVTQTHTNDLERFKVTLPKGQTAQDTKEGFVFEIKLNQNAKWQNGRKITAGDYLYSMRQLLNPRMKNYRANLFCTGEAAIAGAADYYSGRTKDFSTVGLYKVDDYTLIYVTQNYIDLNYFLSSCTSSWLVCEEVYEAGRRSEGGLELTSYGTSIDSTASCGPYMLQSLQNAKQMVLVQNPNWYGYTEQDGKLVSYTSFEVDGEHVRQYETTRIIIDVLDSSSARSAFLKGELSVWTPSADELNTYSSSDRLYTVPETYAMSLFFNTDIGALKKMDAQGNKNSIVISNHSFRKAMSLCIDRAKLCSATSGNIPQYTLLSDLYHYDIYNDPDSSYRASNEAMREICKLYGVSYGEGEAHSDLSEAYGSITGYDPSRAKALMKQAYNELRADGLYSGGDITIRVAWAKGALSSDDSAQITLLTKFLNDAAQGSGFGRITLEGVGNIENRYDAVPAGQYAIGYGAWGGAAFYPFRNMQVYMDPDEYSINEAACYDPKTEMLTLRVDGSDVTKTWQEWSKSMIGSGEYSDADVSVKLSILSQLEAAFLGRYFRIPLCSSTICSVISYQCENYTDKYDLMYDFGGLRLMSYNYNDGEWSRFVRNNGGTLSYE